MSTTIYRIDKFIVPDNAHHEFLSKIHFTHDLLRKQRGFVQDSILEKSVGTDEFNLVTIVEWEDSDSISNARDAVKALHEEMNFNPQEFMTRLNIKADRGDYTRL